MGESDHSRQSVKKRLTKDPTASRVLIARAIRERADRMEDNHQRLAAYVVSRAVADIITPKVTDRLVKRVQRALKKHAEAQGDNRRMASSWAAHRLQTTRNFALQTMAKDATPAFYDGSIEFWCAYADINFDALLETLEREGVLSPPPKGPTR